MRAHNAGPYAERFMRALAAAGVRDVVVCPGSRSQALALAAAKLAREGALDVHVRIDERSGGFFALGVARESGTPAAIVVTSGSAVANLHPALIEAHHSDVPLIVVSADRPGELRGTRANQTAHQIGMFGESARVTLARDADELYEPEVDAVDAVRAALGWRASEHTEPGPVHVNLGFRPPLSETGNWPLFARVDRVEPPKQHDGGGLGYQPNTVVVAGADAGASAAALAEALHAPLIAEPSSNARTGRALVPVQLLDTPLAADIRRVIVVGHPTLSRAVTALIQRDDVEHVTIGRRGQDNVPGRLLTGRVSVEPADGVSAAAWLRDWQRAARAHWADADADADAEGDTPTLGPEVSRAQWARQVAAESKRAITREALVTALWQHTWPHDRLVLGASRLIRVLDKSVAGKAITVHANRGLAGIDGTVSTAHGVAVALERLSGGGITRVLLGDLTLLHDVGGLYLPQDEPRPRLQIIVGNDFGGTIFDALEVADTADTADFMRVQRTPHAVDLRALAAAYGLEYRLITERGALDRALTESRTCLIEVRFA